MEIRYKKLRKKTNAVLFLGFSSLALAGRDIQPTERENKREKIEKGNWKPNPKSNGEEISRFPMIFFRLLDDWFGKSLAGPNWNWNGNRDRARSIRRFVRFSAPFHGDHFFFVSILFCVCAVVNGVPRGHGWIAKRNVGWISIHQVFLTEVVSRLFCAVFFRSCGEERLRTWSSPTVQDASRSSYAWMVRLEALEQKNGSVGWISIRTSSFRRIRPIFLPFSQAAVLVFRSCGEKGPPTRPNPNSSFGRIDGPFEQPEVSLFKKWSARDFLFQWIPIVVVVLVFFSPLHFALEWKTAFIPLPEPVIVSPLTLTWPHACPWPCLFLSLCVAFDLAFPLILPFGFVSRWSFFSISIPLAASSGFLFILSSVLIVFFFISDFVEPLFHFPGLGFTLVTVSLEVFYIELAPTQALNPPLTLKVFFTASWPL